MKPGESLHILKVLTGPHTGAQVRLGESVVIGSDAGSDIVLSDPQIVPRHCRVELQEDKYLVTPLDGVVYLAGKQINGSVPAAMGDVVTLGTTHFAMGPVNQAWPDLKIPEIHSISSKKKESSGEVSPATGTGIQPSRTSRQKGANLLTIFLVLGLGLCVIAFGLSLFLGSENQPEKASAFPGIAAQNRVQQLNRMSEEAMDGLKKKIQEQVPGAGFSEAKRMGRTSLRIFVDNLQEAATARRVVNSDPMYVATEIFELDEMRSMADSLAAAMGYEMKATVSKDGVLSWKGYIPSEEDWNLLRTRVKSDLPFLEEGPADVLQGTEVIRDVESKLKAAGLSAFLSVATTREGLMFTGALEGKSFESEWNNVLAQIRQKYGEDLKISDEINTATDRPNLQKIFGEELAGVSFGRMSWVELRNGKKIFPGSVLEEGFTLEGITGESLLLRGPNGTMRIALETLSFNPQTQSSGSKDAPGP